MTLEQIQQSLDAGIITQAQADAMRVKIADKASAASENPDMAMIGNEDNMRFVRSFSDVFIAIGVGLLALGLSFTAALFGGGISFLGAAIVMAILAEYFGKRKRQHLPTLITALAFLLFTQRGLSVVIGDAGLGGGMTVAAISLGAMLLFYWRVRLPFCIALIALATLYLFFAIIKAAAPGIVQDHFGWMILFSGLITFAVALWYDTQDKHRTTRFADNAFWLHFTAAPLIIHGLALILVRLESQLLFNVIPMVSLDRKDAGLVVLMVIFVALIGLAINRRALLVSSLGYAGFAIAFLMQDTGLGFGKIAAFTLLILGVAIIFLGAGWHNVRNAMLKVLPKWSIFPPPFDPNYKL